MTGSTATGSHSFYQYKGGTPQWVPTLCNQGYGPRGHSPLYWTGSLAVCSPAMGVLSCRLPAVATALSTDRIIRS